MLKIEKAEALESNGSKINLASEPIYEINSGEPINL
jgi:hypothetical protein